MLRQQLHRMIKFTCVLLSLLACLAKLPAADEVPVDYSSIRGANYVPSYAVNNVVQWLEYDPVAVDRELGYAEKLGLNSLRVFLQSIVYEHDPARFLRNLDNFVDLCDKHRIRPMFVFFDSCFGISPSLESNEQWVANPGPNHLGKEHWPRLERYVRAIVEHYRGDPRVLIWDIMNEPKPTVYWPTDEKRATEDLWNFVRHFCRFVNELDSTHPVTVGITAKTDASHVSDLVDVLSSHSYRVTPEELRKNLDYTRAEAARVGKPWLISECGSPGWGSDYEMVMPILRSENIGYYFWELMIGKNQFRNLAGIFYPDGTVRNKSHVRAVMGETYREEAFTEKPFGEGIPMNPFGKRYRDVRGLELALKTFERMAGSPTTAQNFSERYTFLKSTVTLTWGGRDVFKPFHPRIKGTLLDLEPALRNTGSTLATRQAIDNLLAELSPDLPRHTRTQIADWFMRW